MDDSVPQAGRRTRRVVLSLGSNVEERLGYLRRGVDALRTARDIAVVAVSDVYETVAVGDPQPDFLNIVVLAETGLTASALLAYTQSIEVMCGRPRGHRPGARTLDVDLVTVDDEICATETLTLPHPRAHERAFVLYPWLALDPAATLPGHGPVRDLAAQVSPLGIRPYEEVIDA